jgi:hypothetical protein
MAQKTKRCSTCKTDTVHQEFKDQSISAGKILIGIALTGLPVFGVRKGSGYYCLRCKTVN